MSRSPLLSPLRKLKAAFVRLLLRAAWLRKWIIWGVRSEYYADLEIAVPLTPRVTCPIPHEAAWTSFHEVFLQLEYAPVFNQIAPPDRWLDLGSHAGFFTAYVLMQRDRRGLGDDFSALLIDGDRRAAAAATRLAAANRVGDRIHFVQGLVASGDEPRAFVERPYMSSSLAEFNSEEGIPYSVPVISEAEILRRLPPPYDLIKIDIEGAELEFFRAYPQVLHAARHVVVEWHHWPGGGLDERTLICLMAEHGFLPLAQVSPAHPVGKVGSGATCGTFLFDNQRANAPAQ